MTDLKIIKIDDVEYVRADLGSAPAQKKAGSKYVIIRTYSAGVFAGYLESKSGQEVVVREARRIWKWAGAASLSQLSKDGVSNPNGCKFPCEVDKIVLLQAIEIIDCTEKARLSIKEVKIWTE